MPTRELEQAPEVVRCCGSCLDFDGPRTPIPFEYSIDLVRFLSPVCDVLARDPRVRQTRVLDPGAEALRIRNCVRTAARIHDSNERIAQCHEFRRRRAAA